MSTRAMPEALERAAGDIASYDQLHERGAAAPEGLDLAIEEKAAAMAGDQGCMESRIAGKVDKRMEEQVLITLLSREKWWELRLRACHHVAEAIRARATEGVGSISWERGIEWP